MCGRYTLTVTADIVARAFGLAEIPELAPRFNIAPTQAVPVVRRLGTDTPRLHWLRWGLVPAWVKDPGTTPLLINARAETVGERPAFREAFRRRRCLVIADGFYEWRPAGRKKQPYYVRMKGGEPFAFAGLWECWGRAGRRIESCTIIVTAANAQVAAVHERMPVILDPRDYALWLDPEVRTPARLAPLLKPYTDGALELYPVGPRVNDPANDGPPLIEPLIEQ